MMKIMTMTILVIVLVPKNYGTELCVCCACHRYCDVFLLRLQLVAAYEILKCNFASASTRHAIVVIQLLQFWFLKKAK